MAAAAATKNDHRAAVEEAFSEFPILETKADTLAGKLSGGQQQILAIARALATKPTLLILDEPTEGIQPSLIDDIAGIIKRLNTERQLTILVAEQNLEFCRAIAQRAYVMDRGTIASETTIVDLLDDQDQLHQLLGV